MKTQTLKLVIIFVLSSGVLSTQAQNTTTHQPTLWDLLSGDQETYQETSKQPQQERSWLDRLFGGQSQPEPQPQQQQTKRHWWQDLLGEQTQQQTQQPQPQRQSWWERLLGRQQQPQPQPQAQKPLEEHLLGAFKDQNFLNALNRIKANPAGVSQWVNTPVNGTTPLVSAVQQNSLPLATLLLLTGAQLNTTDAQGRTPLQIAQAQGNRELITLLQLAQSSMGRMIGGFLRNMITKSLMQEAPGQQTYGQQDLTYSHKGTTAPALASGHTSTQTPYSI